MANAVDLHSIDSLIQKCSDNVMGLSLLHIAAFEGHSELVESVLARNVGEVNARDRKGRAPLHLVCYPSHLETAFSIKRLRGSVNIPSKDASEAPYASSLRELLQVVKVLIARGAELNCVDDDKMTPLMAASKNGLVDVVQELLQAGADTSSRDKDGWTALFYAHLCPSSSLTLDVVTALLAHGAQVNDHTDKGVTPLMFASCEGHSQIATKLLEAGADVHTRDNDGCTAVYPAVSNGHVSMVNLLLQHGADVEQVDNAGNSPLHAAAIEGHGNLASLLLDNKAFVDARNKDGATPLFLASYQGHADVVRLLLTHKADMNTTVEDYTVLSIASCQGHAEVIRLLLNHGVKVDASGGTGYTALMAASWEGHDDIVQLLLDAGADSNVKNSSGWTALHYAAWKHLSVVRLLIDSGADLLAQTKDGNTPMDIACAHRHSDIAELLASKTNEAQDNAFFGHVWDGDVEAIKSLIKTGVRVNGRNWEGDTTLNIACRHGHLAVVRLLLHYGASVNKRDLFGRTPLHNAIQYGHQDIVDLLLQHKANVNAETDLFNTPLHYACKMNDKSVVIKLLQHGAFLDVKNGSQQTPMDLASERSLLFLLEQVYNGTVTTLSDICKYEDMKSPGVYGQGQAGTPEEADVKTTKEERARPANGEQPDMSDEKKVADLAKKHDVNDDIGLGTGDLMDIPLSARALKIIAPELEGEETAPTEFEGRRRLTFTDTLDFEICCSGSVEGAAVLTKADGRRPLTLINRGLSLSTDVDVNYDSDPEDMSLCLVIQSEHGEPKEFSINHTRNLDKFRETLSFSENAHGAEPLIEQIAFPEDEKFQEIMASLLDDHFKALRLAIIDGRLELVEDYFKSSSHDRASAHSSGRPQTATDVNRKDKYGTSLLHTAASFGRTQLVDLLVAHGAQVDVQDDSGATPLHLAVEKRRTATVEQLLLRNADVNAQNKQGNTALHIAAQNGCSEIAEMLVGHGARTDIKNKNGGTACALSGKNPALRFLFGKRSLAS